jgi:multidrug resistance efflux pump
MIPRGLIRRMAPRRGLIRAAVIVLLVLVLAWGAWQVYEARMSSGRLFGSGSIEATQVDVSPKVAGRIVRMMVSEGEHVKAGQVLAELAPQEASAQVAQAQAAVAQAEAKLVEAAQAVTAQEQATNAQVAQAQAQVQSVTTGVPQAETALVIQERTAQEAVQGAVAALNAAQGQVRAAQSALAKAGSDLGRTRTLFVQGAVAAQDVDAARAAYDAAVAQDRGAREGVIQAQANLATAQANLKQVEIKRQAVEAARANVSQAQAGLRNAQSGYTVIAQRRQDLAAAQAALAQARANLQLQQVLASHNVVTSPLDGVVQSKNIQEGEVVSAGTSLYTLIDLQDTWLRAFIPEDQIARVKVGQAAHVSVDSFPGRIFQGHVTEISSRGEFTPGNVQTRGDRVKLVFGVKIRLDNRDGSLKPGMPADAEIMVGSPQRAGR